MISEALKGWFAPQDSRGLNTKMKKAIMLLSFLSQIAFASEINFEKIKYCSEDLYNLVSAVYEKKEPDLEGKLKRDRKGYYVECSNPESALKIISDASNEKIIDSENNKKYILIPLEGKEGFVTALEKNNLYFARTSNLDLYHKYIIKPKKKEKPKLKKEIKKKPEYDYIRAISKIYGKNPDLAYLIESKVLERTISENSLKDYLRLQDVYDIHEKTIDYAVYSEDYSKELQLIEEVFRKKSEKIYAVNGDISIRIDTIGDNLITVEKILNKH